MSAQSTKANLEKLRKTNAKSAREQRQALQMTYQVRTVRIFEADNIWWLAKGSTVRREHAHRLKIRGRET